MIKDTQTAAGITNLRLKFPGNDALLFKGLSLSVQKGEKVLLLGPSGCGKSTLLQVLSGLIPRSVEVPMKCDDAVIPVRPGFIFQDPDTQFCMPYADEELAFVFENLHVKPNDMPAKIRHYLNEVGLHLDDPHTLIQTMSQGMKQRLAIASALAMEPDVLLLDEPTALLDQAGTVQVWDTIKQLASDTTLIIVEHKIDEIADYVDRIVVFSPEGNIIADGHGEEVFVRHKKQLADYGIWYPGVWQDYLEEYGPKETESNSAQKEYYHSEQISIPIIELERFSALRSGDPVIYVDKVSVSPGDWIGIVGKNGAGKSSLLLALMRLLKTEGAYQFEGKQAGKVEQLAEKIAFVFQNPEFQFVTHSVQDEVEYSLLFEPMNAEKRQSKVNAMLEQFDLQSYTDRHPYQLSMGQKRRLSVAASMIRDQAVLLLDEPTFGQDAKNTFAILEKLEELRAQGTAIVMVTHDLEIVNHFCTKVWNIKNGRLSNAVHDTARRNVASSRESRS
ncbi:ABC transporter ATP-binding protein [Paenibacillus sediminis]|uniref:Energy-coupling factor transport system ATP-binding protein n=1 Tax=Paenibacillus sediminis TaxID=664909 RepID=A0ABS4H3F5_9BACL|nr:ABC transporter ATP-binding protein [Paenibacillus sediminis]MBP1936996.1 energy-coupling factor transport system ATP-binding protein [Paenibacillus sediminis]